MPGYVESFPEYVRKQCRGFSNPAFPQMVIADHNIDRSERSIINIGGMKDNKNLIDLLNAFILVKDDYPEWKINVFGKDASRVNAYISNILDLIRNNSLQDRVIICGPTDDIFKEFSRSDIHVISSLEEGCPTCVLEAMATGVPSIGFENCAGTNELIVDGVNGLLVSSEGRVESLAQALRSMMASKELRIKYGEKALLDSKVFVPGLIYNQWEQLFIEMATYKDCPDRLMDEQMSVDPERAMHAKRMRSVLMREFGYE
jgi:glycosyltransferase involved in cell wall biosynthesis